MWIELTVDGNTVGRQQVAAVPYARFASRAGTATDLEGGVVNAYLCNGHQASSSGGVMNHRIWFRER